MTDRLRKHMLSAQKQSNRKSIIGKRIENITENICNFATYGVPAFYVSCTLYKYHLYRKYLSKLEFLSLKKEIFQIEW